MLFCFVKNYNIVFLCRTITFLSKMVYVLLEHFELISSIVLFVISINVRLVRFLALNYLAPSLSRFCI
jgi:hypothetical protein